MAPSDILLDWSPPWMELHVGGCTCPSHGTLNSPPVVFQEQVNIPQWTTESFKSWITLPQEPSTSTKQFPGDFSGKVITDTGVFCFCLAVYYPRASWLPSRHADLACSCFFRSVFIPLFLGLLWFSHDFAGVCFQTTGKGMAVFSPEFSPHLQSLVPLQWSSP